MLNKIQPTLESITVTGKYEIRVTDFQNVVNRLEQALKHSWHEILLGDSVTFMNVQPAFPQESDCWEKRIKELRKGVVASFNVVVLEYLKLSIIVEISCRPAMWYRISTLEETEFTENQVQEALIECRLFAKQVMSSVQAREIEPVSVYPIIPRREIRSRLLNLGLKKTVDLLDKSEKNIIQNNFDASLKSSRTAFEKMIDYQMKKRGLEQTNNYKNDIERLGSKGFLDPETAKLLQSYYRCISIIGVHEKVKTPAGIFEAQMGYGLALIIIDYLNNKLP